VRKAPVITGVELIIALLRCLIWDRLLLFGTHREHARGAERSTLCSAWSTLFTTPSQGRLNASLLPKSVKPVTYGEVTPSMPATIGWPEE